jgi:hypothetical protein
MRTPVPARKAIKSAVACVLRSVRGFGLIRGSGSSSPRARCAPREPGGAHVGEHAVLDGEIEQAGERGSGHLAGTGAMQVGDSAKKASEALRIVRLLQSQTAIGDPSTTTYRRQVAV